MFAWCLSLRYDCEVRSPAQRPACWTNPLVGIALLGTRHRGGFCLTEVIPNQLRTTQ